VEGKAVIRVMEGRGEGREQKEGMGGWGNEEAERGGGGSAVERIEREREVRENGERRGGGGSGERMTG